MNKADMVEVVQRKGGFVQIWHPEKKDKAMEAALPWGQAIELLFKDFKDLKEARVSDTITVVGKGSITRIDEKGISLRIEQAKVAI